MKELDGNFIATEKSGDSLIVHFHNPSVRDFLQIYIAANLDELQSVLRSIACFDQLHWLWEHRHSATNRYRFRKIIKQQLSADFLLKLEVSLQLPVYSLEVQYIQGEFIKGRTNVSLAERILLISSIASEMKTKRSHDILTRSLVNLNEAIDLGRIQPEDLVNLAIWLQGKLDAKRWKNLLNTTKTFLGTSLSGIEDFRALTRLLEAFPDIFSETEIAGFAKSFPTVAQRFVWGVTTADPDDLRIYAEEINSIAEHLNVDVLASVNDLEERAAQAEELAEQEEQRERREALPEEPDRLDTLKTRERTAYEASDSAIESMFSSLR